MSLFGTPATVFLAGASSSLPVTGIVVAICLAVLPVLIIAGTSFLKISVVLAIIRSALGAPDVPPTVVLTALSAVLTMFVMAPVASEMATAVEEAAAFSEEAGGEGIVRFKRLYNAAGPPLLAFLKENASAGEVAFFEQLAGPDATAERGFRILLPAFAVGELIEAFLIGFLVFIPFLVIDLIVAIVLSALGMPMLSPTAVSLPLKLLLFVAVDGWHVILSGLLVNYGA